VALALLFLGRHVRFNGLAAFSLGRRRLVVGQAVAVEGLDVLFISASALATCALRSAAFSLGLVGVVAIVSVSSLVGPAGRPPQ
jgi:hypothetical protein